jgi:hypothetical protein
MHFRQHRAFVSNTTYPNVTSYPYGAFEAKCCYNFPAINQANPKVFGGEVSSQADVVVKYNSLLTKKLSVTMKSVIRG